MSTSLDTCNFGKTSTILDLWLPFTSEIISMVLLVIEPTVVKDDEDLCSGHCCSHYMSLDSRKSPARLGSTTHSPLTMRNYTSRSCSSTLAWSQRSVDESRQDFSHCFQYFRMKMDGRYRKHIRPWELRSMTRCRSIIMYITCKSCNFHIRVLRHTHRHIL